MPGPVSESYAGPSEDGPYVPGHCYPNSAPKVCPCGCHEGFHNDAGACLRAASCGCSGLPADCLTPDADFYEDRIR